MSIATAITAAQGKVANAYTAVSTKGGTLPATQNLSNLPTAISSIPSGITPTGTLSITTNGVYNVTNYASADVSVSGSLNVYLATCSCSSSDPMDTQNAQYTLTGEGVPVDSGECRVYASYNYSINKTIVCLSIPIDTELKNAYSFFQLECSVSSYATGSKTISASWGDEGGELELYDCTIS